MSGRTSKADALLGVAAAVVVALMYSVVVTETYAWTDDYSRLATAVGLLPRASFVEDASGGRPLAGPLMQVGFAAARSISGLRYLRAASVLGIALLAAMLAVHVKRLGVDSGPALLFAVSAVLLPPFQLYAGWATAYLFSWTCLLSLGAGLWWLDASSARMRVAGFAGLIAANLVYQPAAFFVWTAVGIRLSLRLDDPRKARREMTRLLVGTLASAACALIVAQGVNAFFHIDWKERSGFVSGWIDIKSKMVWFVTRPLVLGARPFLIESPGVKAVLLTAGPAAMLVMGDWLSRTKGTLMRRLSVVTMLLAVPAFAMTPNLITRENQIEFRTLPGLCVTMWWYLCSSIYFLGRRLRLARSFERSRLLRVTGYAAIVVAVGALAVTSRRHIVDAMIVPNRAKDDYLAARLREFDPARHHRIVVVNDPAWWRPKRLVGTFSISSDLMLDWVPVPDVLLKAAEAGIDVSKITVSVQAIRPPDTPPSFVVDLSGLRPDMAPR